MFFADPSAPIGRDVLSLPLPLQICYPRVNRLSLTPVMLVRMRESIHRCEGCPGPDWCLTDHAEFLWEQTFCRGPRRGVQGRQDDVQRGTVPDGLAMLP
jgi:hypothetical protein